MKITKISKDMLIPTIWDGGETFEYYIYPENALYANRDFFVSDKCCNHYQSSIYLYKIQKLSTIFSDVR